MAIIDYVSYQETNQRSNAC